MLRTKSWLLACTTLSVLACPLVRADEPPKFGSQASKSGVAAYIAGEAILMRDVDAEVMRTNMKLAQSLYDARRAALDQIIMERLLAKDATAKGMAADKLVLERIAEKTKPVTEEEVKAYFDKHKGRMPGRTLEQVAGQIRPYLKNQRTSEAKEDLLEELKRTSMVQVTLEPPRVEVIVAADDPYWGPADAKVTIVEYSDFQ